MNEAATEILVGDVVMMKPDAWELDQMKVVSMWTDFYVMNRFARKRMQISKLMEDGTVRTIDGWTWWPDCLEVIGHGELGLVPVDDTPQSEEQDPHTLYDLNQERRRLAHDYLVALASRRDHREGSTPQTVVASALQFADELIRQTGGEA